MTSVGGEEVRIAENAPLAARKPARKRRIMAGSDKTERGGADHRLRTAGNPGRGYARVPSRATLSTSTTSTSIATECGNHQSIGQDDQKHFEENEEQGQQDQYYYEEDEEEEEDDEENNFESDRLHFQQLRQISLGSENKYKMEMEVRGAKDENLRNAVPFVRELSDAGKLKERGSEFSINGDVPQYRATKIYILTQILAALSVSMGSLVVGYATAYTSPALATMIHENSTIVVTVQQGSWVGGLMPLAALVGGILGGPLIEYLGRRNTILATGLPFTISWILIATAPNVYMVYVGRAIGGLCVGIGSLSFPVYLGETVQPEVRGRLGLLPTALGNVGILICFCAGYSLDWSNLAFLGALLPVPFVCLTFFIPETPRWYVSQGQTEKAREALVWLRGDKADVSRELGEIVKSHSEAEHRASGSKFGELFEKEHIRPVLISLGLMFFQQMSGINAVIFYTVTIFKAAESDVDENLSTIIVGIVNFGSTFVATLLIDRLGRKMLLYISAATMIITLMTLGSFFYVLSLGVAVEGYGWVPLVSMVMYVIGFSLGFGPIPWLMMGEILPAKIRGTAASVATAFNWSCTFVVTKTFADIILSVGTHGAFWMFGIICVFGLFFTIFWVPETRGKSLEEIEQKLSGRTRQTNSIANNKPSSADC